ncbi:MAG: DegV family protein [Oscillospiraceae bacterium]
MEKILLMTDSSSDISKEMENELKIRVLNMPVAINGESYFDRESFSNDEFYEILNNNEEIPVTSHITAPVFMDEYLKAYNEGYTDIIYVSINENGSATYNASMQGKELLFDEYPELREKLNLYLIPSKTFSMGYGMPVALGAKMLNEETHTAKEIVAAIEEYLLKFDVCFSMYTLKFAKKSGRLSATAAFVGEMLGIRPLLTFRNGSNLIFDKVRGDKNIVPAIADYYLKNRVDGDDNYYIAIGEDQSVGVELENLIFAKTGKKAKMIYKEGACIAINAGPRIIGIGFMSKNKNEK